MKLHTVPHWFGANNFTTFNSLFGAVHAENDDWTRHQPSCSDVSGASAQRGQYANWARPQDALMGTAVSFQSELLETSAPSTDSGG